MKKTFLLCCLPIFFACMSFTLYAQAAPAAAPDSFSVLTKEYPPLSFSQDGKITGLETEVVREMMRRMGRATDISMVKWVDGVKAALESPNTILFSMGMTAKRKPLFQWAGPIGILNVNLYAKKGSGITLKTLQDAKSLPKIATVKGYYTERILVDNEFKNIDSNETGEAALKKLLKGETQLFICNNIALHALLKNAGVAPENVEPVYNLSSDLSYIAFSKGIPGDTVKRWQDTLDGMKRDGTFQRIYSKWLPGNIPPGIYQLMTEEYPPVTFSKNGKITGFVTDMVRGIISGLNIPDNIRLTSWASAYNMALINPNVALFSTERTQNREKLFNWVGPVGKNSAIFYKKKGAPVTVKGLEDAKKVAAIATTTNWFTEQYLKDKGFTNLKSSPLPSTSIKQLMKGEVQLTILTDITVTDIVKDAGYTMNDIEPVYTALNTYFYIALSLGTPDDVVKQWQTALDKMKKDGAFEKIYRQYLPAADIRDLLVTGK